MTTAQPPLDQLQRWMLTAITHPAGIATGLSSAEIEQQLATSLEELQSIILPSRQQSAAQRLAVYHHAYFARLLEVLRELFPCTRFAVGDELFNEFAVGYLERHPPHSYTLARLADRLVEYLNATRPADWGGFVVELARLEQTIDRIFDGPGPEDLPPYAAPLAASAELRLPLVPGFELLAFQFPVSTYYTDWKASRQPAWPAAAEQFVALLRRDFVVRRFELSSVQYELLSALHRGCTLGEGLAAAADSAGDVTADALANNVRSWFTLWAAQGFFAGG